MGTTENTTTKAIDAALIAIRATQAEKHTERETIAESLRVIDAELRQLAVAERALDPKAVKAPVASGVDRVRAVMEARGKATMHEVAEAINKPKNSAKHGLQKLEAEGVIRRTGATRNRSPEFEVIAAA